MNEQHLNMLRSGVAAWNEWRAQHPDVRPDLSEATLNFLATKSTLDRNNSIFERFQRRNYQAANLDNVDLRAAKLWLCDLQGATLQHADLRQAEIRRSDLTGANLQGADLQGAQFLTCDLTDAHFEGASWGDTHLGYTKLRDAHGLAAIHHHSASYIDQFSLIHSVPLPDELITVCNVPPLTLRMANLHRQLRTYHTCFISYSRRDEVFVSYLREALTWAGVPSWFAPNDMRAETWQSDERELQRDLYNYVDEAELLILVMSPNILSSSWVGMELLRMIHTRKKIVALLVDIMPPPDSDEWNRRIAIATGNRLNSHFAPTNYSQSLTHILQSQHYLSFVDWRNPSGMAYFFSHLLAQLRYTQ